MSVKIDFNMEKALQRRTGTDYRKLKRFVASEFVRLTDPLVPFREGYLKGSANISVDGDWIRYEGPYARYQYYGVDFNFNGAPQRGALWGERSLAINRKAIVRSAQIAINMGRL